MKQEERLTEKLDIIEQHIERNIPVKALTNGELTELELLRDIAYMTRDLLHKIEKGKLVEFPSMVYSQTHECYILYTKDGEFINSCLCTKAQAEARLKELRND